MPTCLMIQTANKRKYFTEATNLPKLLEFAQTFGAELFLVETTDIEPIQFDNLATALCAEDYRTPKQSRKAVILRQLYPGSTKERRSMLENAQTIRSFIRTKLQQGEVLKVKDVKCKFGNLKLSDPCISNHITTIRLEMKKSGFDVVRIKTGSYKLN